MILEPGEPDRELTLVVYTRNMPETISPRIAEREGRILADRVRAVNDLRPLLSSTGSSTGALAYIGKNLTEYLALGQARAAIERLYPQRLGEAPPQLWFDTLLEGYPTYRVAAYHDSARDTVFEGEALDVLIPQTSFGYYVAHDGPLFGWSHALDGPLTEVQRGVYRVRIPHGGFAKLRARIKVLESDEDEVLEVDRQVGGIFERRVGNMPDGGDDSPFPDCKCRSAARPAPRTAAMSALALAVLWAARRRARR
jgi:hypothetical protein